MRRIVGAAFVSLDGVMQGPGGPTEDPTGGFAFSGWLPPVGDEGNIIATYAPAGPVQTGSYITEAPSEREQARQAAMAECNW